MVSSAEMPVPSQMQGISATEMEQILQRLHAALQEPASLIRFFALKSQGNTTGVTPWKTQLAMRNDPLMCEMRSLIGSAVWMLVTGRDFAYSRRPGNRRH